MSIVIHQFSLCAVAMSFPIGTSPVQRCSVLVDAIDYEQAMNGRPLRKVCVCRCIQ